MKKISNFNVVNIIPFVLLAFISIEFIINIDFFSKNIYESYSNKVTQTKPYQDVFLGISVFFLISLLVLSVTGYSNYFKFWIVKGFVTLILLIPYEVKYVVDAFYYAKMAGSYYDYDLLYRIWGDGGTTRIITFYHYLSYVVGDGYYALKVTSSFIGFLGISLFYKSYLYILSKTHIQSNDAQFSYILFLFPSIIFWSSGLGKESLMLFSIGLFVYSFLRFIDKITVKYFILITLSILGMFLVREWMAVIALFSMGLFYLTHLTWNRLMILALLVMPVYFFTSELFSLRAIVSFESIFELMTHTSKVMTVAGGEGASSVDPTVYNGFGDYLYYYIPNMFTTLFRPMPWDIKNIFTLIASIENIFLLYFFTKFIIFKFSIVVSNKYILFLFLFLFCWSLLYVVISPTNLGAAIRFKVQVLPIILIILWASRLIFNSNKKGVT